MCYLIQLMDEYVTNVYSRFYLPQKKYHHLLKLKGLTNLYFKQTDLWV